MYKTKHAFYYLAWHCLLCSASVGHAAPTHNPNSTESQDAIQSVIRYNAKGAITFNVRDRRICLRDVGNVEYDTVKLEADVIQLDWPNHTVTAHSVKREAGETTQKVVLIRDGIEYTAESVRYNFISQLATAHKLFTKQGDSILRGQKIRKDAATVFYTDHAHYTTCDHTKPHFHVSAKKIKIIEGKKVVSGPFRLYFDGVPTPLGFPFGIFYLPQNSGIIFPRYDISERKGFGLTNGGYYFHFNDYINLALQGSIYAKGSRAWVAKSQYKKRYHYRGDLFYKNVTGLPTQATEQLFRKSGWEMKWEHHSEHDKASSFTAAVHLKNKNFHEAMRIYGEPSNAQETTSSSVKYTNMLPGCPYTLFVSLQHTHNTQEQSTEVTIPSIMLQTTNIYPLRRKRGTTKHWYTNVYLQHTAKFDNKLSNEVGDRTLDFLQTNDWQQLWAHRRWGIQHTIPLQTDIKCLRYLHLTPQFTWRERWYGEKTDYTYDTTGHDIVKKKVPGFVRVYDYDAKATLKTILYGTYTRSRSATIQALRHELEPVITFNYTPAFPNYWQTIQGGPRDGEKRNRFAEAVHGAPGNQTKMILGIALNNRLYMKLRNGTDAQKPVLKIPILEGFDWSTGYDFQEEEHPWKDVVLHAHTSILDKMFSFNLKMTFDPYVYQPTTSHEAPSKKQYVRSSKLALRHGRGLGHLQSVSLDVNVKLSTITQVHSDTTHSVKPKGNHDATPSLGTRIIGQHSGGYMDSTVPWDLNVSYQWSYTRMKPGDDPKKTSSLGLEGTIRLTPKWQIAYKSVYDLTQSKWVGNATSIKLFRDLHCWDMDFEWNPLGDTQTYLFSIGLKAPLLRDLRPKRHSYYEKC